MRNPFLTKNPFMSVWLSSANRVANSARGKATSEMKRSLGAAQAVAIKQVVDFWSGKSAPQAKPTKPRRKRR